jgi:formate dehydrogenase subunit gamma
MPSFAAWALGGAIALMGAILALRGCIRIETGWAGWTLRRFSRRERACHWLLALTCIALALTGPAYGRLRLPLWRYAERDRSVGPMAPRTVAFAFTAALGWAFLLTQPAQLARHRLARQGRWPADARRAPPAWKFNSAQKLLFWLVMLAGALLSLSGFALLSSNATGSVTTALALLNALGAWFGLAPVLPTQPSPQQALEYAMLCHGAVALGLLGAVIVHIGLRTLLIEGTFSAMTRGEVDANWARQHHSLWAEREISQIAAAIDPGDVATKSRRA